MTDHEKEASDAPVWYNAEEASAWANGYNAAMDEVKAEKSNSQPPQMVIITED